MRILLVCHKPIFSPAPRGGEKSVRIIADYLSRKGHYVNPVNAVPPVSEIKKHDLVLTWGRPAVEAAKKADAAGVPLALMVRFWKNVAPNMPNGGYGDLLRREVQPGFAADHMHLFRYASAVITNTKYARQVIHYWQPAARGNVHVSYVPITGEYKESGRQDGALTIVTPEVYGEQWLVRNLVNLLSGQKIQVVNVNKWDRLTFDVISENVTAHGYRNMSEVWEETSILLVPIFNNDICGTRRVTIEAFRRGIPAILHDKCGVNERVPAAMLVRRDAGPIEWAEKIREVLKQYGRFRNLAKAAWKKYDTDKELDNFEKILLECV